MTGDERAAVVAEALRGMARDPHARAVLSKAFREAGLANSAAALHALADEVSVGAIALDAQPGDAEQAGGRVLVSRGACSCGETKKENRLGHRDGCRYFSDSIYTEAAAAPGADAVQHYVLSEDQTAYKVGVWRDGVWHPGSATDAFRERDLLAVHEPRAIVLREVRAAADTGGERGAGG